LEGCGAAELICKFLRIPGLELRLGLTNQLISFGIAFLLGGNTQPQNSILEKFMQDGSNLMLINYRQLIKRVSRAVYNNFRFRKNKKFYESEFNVNLYDNFDYYDDTLKMMTRANAIE
jgi:inositol 1,4,5-triphosphate receptor type 1/inositol 1,4,5-triphosphate receptor type 3